MTTDTKLKELIINKLTTSQYTSIEEKDPNQIYIVTDALAFDNTITNCLTHIPQDIKLELVDDTLSLKAGSKVTFPDESVLILSNDLVTSGVSFDGPCFVFVNKGDNSLFFRASNQCMTGTEIPTAAISGIYQYLNVDTKKTYVWQNSAWVELDIVSLPIGMVTLQTSAPYIKSFDQTFNGFGYVGSTVFALPGVRGLIPNGRNKDGTLKNIEFVTNKVLTATKTGSFSNEDLRLSENNIDIGGLNYIESDNLNYSGTNIRYLTIAGKVSMTSDSITSLTPKTPFQAVDFNSISQHVVVSTLPANPNSNTFYYIPS